MGMYINPTNGMRKLDWARAYGAELVQNPTWPAPEGKVYLSWVDNGFFDALGVCFSQREFESCQWIDKDPGDDRPHRWFTLDKSAVLRDDSGVEDHYKDVIKKM